MARVNPYVDREIRKMLEDAAKKGLTPSFPVKPGLHLSPKEQEEIKRAFLGHRSLPAPILPEDTEPKVSSLTDDAFHSRAWIISPDGREIRLPTEIFKALINSAGGCVVVDAGDIINADRKDEEVIVTEYKDPWKVVFSVEKTNRE